MTTAERIDTFISQPALAIVGMSRSGNKFGNIACRELRAKGYRVYPVHHTARLIDGVTCYARFTQIPEPVTAALIVVPPEAALDVVRDAAAAGIRHVWLQQGAESPQVLELCDRLGLETVAGECILMFTKPTGFHRAHRWIRSVCGTLPASPRAKHAATI
jgi:uncharacterized protein